jgi:hypothetical protein
MGNRQLRTLLLCALVLAFSAALMGCGGAKSSAEKPAAAAGVIEKPTLQQFFDADSKTGEFTLVATESDGKRSSEMTGTLWVDGRKFRYSLWVDGKLIRDITSPDGKTAYFVEHEGKYSEPSVASVDRYLTEFSEPATGSVEDGVDKETGATRMLYAIKKLDNLAGADNAWYTEDIVYLVKDGTIIGTITRGDTPNKDGSAYDLRTARRMFSNLTVGEKIPADTFVLPYPIKNAK